MTFSTLTVQNLTPGIPYYLRVGGVNWRGVANWVYFGGSGGNTAWVADYSGRATWPINNLKTVPMLGTAITGMIRPQAVAITPDGNTAWVADNQAGKAWPINNLNTTPTLGTAITGVSNAVGIAITPDGNTAWVAGFSSGNVWPINNLKTAPTRGTAVTGMGRPNRHRDHAGRHYGLGDG